MMPFTVDKKHFFKLLLVIYFLVYSISPLTYTRSNKQVPEHIYATNKESSSIKSVQILVWEFFLEGPSSIEETSHTDGNASILIKKKRALAPENASNKLFFSNNMSVPKDCYNPFATTSYSLKVLPANILGIYRGFNPLYAGNSPPTA
jgi:hypothetical protein